MDFVLRIIIVSLAVYRLSEMFTIDDGPFSIFGEIRGWLAQHTSKSPIINTLHDGINCRYCTGVWFSILLTPFIFYQNGATDFVIMIFAVAGIQSIFVCLFGR